MDTKLIKEFGTEILCYRLRTARQKKRMQYKDFDKQLIKINRTRNELHERKRNLGWEPLIPPYQRGWKRSYELIADVARSRNANFFEEILRKINTHDWSHRKDFKVKKRKRGRKTLIVKTQQLLQPGEGHFNRLGFTEAEKQFFHPEFHYEKWNSGLVKRYVFNEPWRFVLRVRPNMITEVKVQDCQLESEIQKVESYIEGEGLSFRMQWLINGHYQYKNRRKRSESLKEVYVYKNMPVIKILDTIQQDI